MTSTSTSRPWTSTLDTSIIRFSPELRRVTPTSPQGQKRVLSIDHPLVYRIRVSGHRGVTWVEDDRSIVWLCAARRREQDSESDAYA